MSPTCWINKLYQFSLCSITSNRKKCHLSLSRQECWSSQRPNQLSPTFTKIFENKSKRCITDTNSQLLFYHMVIIFFIFRTHKALCFYGWCLKLLFIFTFRCVITYTGYIKYFLLHFKTRNMYVQLLYKE